MESDDALIIDHPLTLDDHRAWNKPEKFVCSTPETMQPMDAIIGQARA